MIVQAFWFPFSFNIVTIPYLPAESKTAFGYFCYLANFPKSAWDFVRHGDPQQRYVHLKHKIGVTPRVWYNQQR